MRSSLGRTLATVFASLAVMLPVVLPAFALAASAGQPAMFTVGSMVYRALNGTTYVMDVAPFIHNGRTYVPVRYLANALGIPDNNVGYNPDARLVYMDDPGAQTQICLAAGVASIVVDGSAGPMDVAPEIRNGRVMLPARWVAQALGYSVDWNPVNHQVAIIPNQQSGNGTIPIVYTSSVVNRSESATEIVPPLTYNSSVRGQTKQFNWSFQNKNYQWRAEVPTQVLSYDHQIYNEVSQFYNSNSGTAQQLMLSAFPQSVDNLINSCSTDANGDYTPWVEASADYVGYVAKWLSGQAANDGYDYFHTAEFALSFVNSAIPYQDTIYPQLSAQTMFNDGDCKDKSILLAAILKDMGYNVALLSFNPPPGETEGHEAVGMAFTGQQVTTARSQVYSYSYNGTNYYFAETTGPGWLIGERSDQVGSTGYGEINESNGSVYPVR